MSSYLVTGASRGLGLEFVRQLSTHPENKVFATARNPDKSAGLQDLIKSHANIIPVKLDITSVADWKAAVETIGKATGGTLDILVHNAADVGADSAMLTPYGASEKIEDLKANIHRDMDTNVLSVFDGTNAFMPLILAGKEKKVVAISSAMGLPNLTVETGLPQTVSYAISKATLNVVIAKYAAEMKSQGVKFLALSPGWVATHEEDANQKAMIDFLLAKFRIHEPKLQGPATPERAVRECLQTIGNFGWDVNGLMVSQHGNQEWFSL